MSTPLLTFDDASVTFFLKCMVCTVPYMRKDSHSSGKKRRNTTKFECIVKKKKKKVSRLTAIENYCVLLRVCSFKHMPKASKLASCVQRVIGGMWFEFSVGRRNSSWAQSSWAQSERICSKKNKNITRRKKVALSGNQHSHWAVLLFLPGCLQMCGFIWGLLYVWLCRRQTMKYCHYHQVRVWRYTQLTRRDGTRYWVHRNEMRFSVNCKQCKKCKQRLNFLF